MPELGEIHKARDIDYKGTCNYIWSACPKCGKERWVQIRKGKSSIRHCQRCQIIMQPHKCGSESRSWKGGRYKNHAGYIFVWLSPDDFFHRMANKANYVMEHRLIIAKHLNRCLLPWEVVHHKGIKYSFDSKDNKADNRIENLELITDKKYHLVDTRVKGYIKKLETEIIRLNTLRVNNWQEVRDYV